jgi:hypothetical protein
MLVYTKRTWDTHKKQQENYSSVYFSLTVFRYESVKKKYFVLNDSKYFPNVICSHLLFECMNFMIRSDATFPGTGKGQEFGRTQPNLCDTRKKTNLLSRACAHLLMSRCVICVGEQARV